MRVKAAELTIEGGGLFAITPGAGPSGDIVVEVEQLTLKEGALIVNTTAGTEAGGTVTIEATESISIVGSESSANALSGVLTVSTGVGSAGRIAIEAPTAAVELERGAIGSVAL